MRRKRAAKIRKQSVLRKLIPPEITKGFWWWLLLETVWVALAATGLADGLAGGGADRLGPLFLASFATSFHRAGTHDAPLLLTRRTLATRPYLTMQNFTSFADAGDYHALLNKALEIKANPYGYQHVGHNKTVGLIFFNPSLRTRLSSREGGLQPGRPRPGCSTPAPTPGRWKWPMAR